MTQVEPKTTTYSLPDATRELAKSLYIQGLPVPKISLTTGVKVLTIRTWISRYKWGVTKARSREMMSQGKEGVPARQSITTNSTRLVKIDSESDDIRKQLQSELRDMLTALRLEPVKAKDLATSRGEQGRAAVVKTLAETAASIFPDWSDSSGGLVIVGEMERSQDTSPTAVEIESSVVTPQPVVVDAQNGNVVTEESKSNSSQVADTEPSSPN